MIKSERISSIILIMFAAFILFETRKYPVGTIDNPGPGFLPILLGIAIGLMSIALLIRAWQADKARKIRIEKTLWPDKKGLFKVSLIFFSILIFTILFEVTGYIINIFFLFLILLKPVGKQRWIPTVIISTGAVLVSYLLFDRWLMLPLPRGIWFE